LRNGNPDAVAAGVAVDSNIVFDGRYDYGLLVLNLGPPRGFCLTANSKMISYVCGDHALVTDCSGYWFGQSNLRSLYLWTQVDRAMYEGNAGLAFSWRSVPVPAFGAAQRRMLVKFGSFSNTNVTLTIVFPTLSGPIEYGDSVSITVNVSDELGDLFFSVFILADGDSGVPSALFRNLSTEPTDISFCPSDFLTRGGSCNLSFFGVNPYGDISDGVVWSLSHGPFPTQSPTPSRSPLATSTQSQIPFVENGLPSINCSLSGSAFNIDGVVGSGSIRTSRYGFRVYFRIGSSSLVSLSGGTVTVDSVQARLNWHFLSSNTAFVSFKVTNLGLTARSVSLAVAGEIQFDGDDYAPMATLSWNRGFRITSSRSEIRFICRYYPLVRDVSSFWIGSASHLNDNYWNQVSDGRISGVDAAAAFAWEYFGLRHYAVVTRGIIVKFGSDEASLPTLSLTFTMFSSHFSPSDPIQVMGTIGSWRHAEDLRLLYVIDNDVAEMQMMNLSFKGNSTISFSFVPFDIGILSEDHQIAFYAVNSGGDVSVPQTFLLGGVSVGNDEGNSGDQGTVLGDPSLFALYSNNTAAIVGPIAAVTAAGLLTLILVLCYIRSKSHSHSGCEASP
jgi:hypothetical protein